MAWTTADSAELYGVPYWGEGLFKINEEGHLAMTPRGPNGGEVDLYEISEELVERGIELPILLRFPDVARLRLQLMVDVFKTAFEEYEFKGRYRGVYPLKVNPQRHLVEQIVQFGAVHHIGLEAGSKAELLVALALLDDPEALLICNGYKDDRYVETALLAAGLGRHPVLVIEKLSELDTIIAASERTGVRPTLGVRAKLSSPGKGRWQSSSGDRAKFGLSALNIVELVTRLRDTGYLDCLKLLHFHIGSQVTSIRTFKRALREATRLYVELTRMGAPMGLFDAGGGLGVDYDGSRTPFESSVNYSEQEYANDVVAAIVAECDEAEVTHPDIVTESGRATVAHCSVLLFDVLGSESLPVNGPPIDVQEDDHIVLHDLREAYDGVNAKTYQESWHDANDGRERALHAFDHGILSLEELARAEGLYWQTLGRVQRVSKDVPFVPEDLAGLEVALADTYYGNLSVFQSLPDSWAIGQLFPIVPVHRLGHRPTRKAVLADITCDSDGKIERFVNRRDIKRTLELHPLRQGERYVIAVTIVGAYQEILGDLHNLFGDTHAVHISVGEDGDYSVDLVIEGDTVTEVINYVQYDRRDLVHRVRAACETAIRTKQMRRDQAANLLAFFQDGLGGYTYLKR